LAKEDFEYRFNNDKEYLRQYNYAIIDNSCNVAAFNFHSGNRAAVWNDSVSVYTIQAR